MKNWMKHSTRQLLAKAMACLMCFLIVNGPVMAIDAADVISSSNADISTVGNTTTVNVLGDRSVTHWSNFNTTAGETLEFKRDSGAGFASLNIVESGTFTQFDGRLLGNQGSIYIINQHGLVFGATAEISAARFTASTLALDMTDTEFLNSTNENYAFKTGSAQGKIELAAGASVVAEQIQLLAHQISNSGVIVGTNDIVLLATGDEIYLASNSDDIIVKINTPNVSTFNYSIVNEAPGQIQNNTGKIVLAAGDTFAHALTDIHNQAYAVGDYNIEQRGTIEAAEFEAGAAQQIALRPGGSTEADSVKMAAQKVDIRQSLETVGDMTIDSDQHITVQAALSSGGDMSLIAHQTTVHIQGQAVSQGQMNIEAGTNLTMLQGASSEETMALSAGNRILSTGDIVGQAGITVTANETLTNADILAADDLTIYSPVILFGNLDQTLESQEGRVTADGSIRKVQPGQLFISGNDPELSVDLQYAGPEWGVSNIGNIYISGLGDIQLSGGLTGMGEGGGILPVGEGEYIWTLGGVSVISQTGAIYTEGSNGLNISIQGFSSDVYYPGGEVTPYAGKTGVDLPFKSTEGESLGKAAIVLQSAQDITIGPEASLDAQGIYLPSSENWGEVVGPDDRPGVNFLAEDAVIGGYDRDQGIPSDVAIYVGSTRGDVIISESAAINVINSSEAGDATVVLDGMESVSMPNAGVLSGKFRLEAASRDSEWLFQAEINNRLPSLAEVEAVLGEGNYIRRGAGLDNAAITDGRQWVLENPETIPAPLAVLELPELKGCPVEMQAASAELGIPAETLQMTIRNALATNPNIQPCEACADLVTAAAILNDADGVRLAAMNQIFNTLAPADAPFTPEVSASVVTAFAQLGPQDRQYALAAEYIDAFVRYVAVLDTELKAPVGDPVAFAFEKYGEVLTYDNINPNIAAYLFSQLMPEGI